MGKKYIYLICFGVTYKTIFFFLDYGQNKITTKLDYLKNFVTHACRPHTAKILTLFKASGLKRHPVKEAQK